MIAIGTKVQVVTNDSLLQGLVGTVRQHRTTNDLGAPTQLVNSVVFERQTKLPNRFVMWFGDAELEVVES